MPVRRESRQFVCGVLLAGCLLATNTRAADAGKPMYGAWGFDLAGADFATSPGDDFFRYANGTWLDKTTIPGDKTGYTLRIEMTDRTEARLREILEAAAARIERQPDTLPEKVGAFYLSFMDEARIEKLGASPLAAQLQALRDADRATLAGQTGRANVDFDPALFAPYIDVDLKDPTRYVVYLTQSGLGLPDRDYYLEPEFAATKEAYRSYVARLLRLLDWPEADARAKDVVEFESQVAAASWTKAQQRDPIATYNPMTPAELRAFAPGFDWQRFLENADLSRATRLIVQEKSAFPRIAAIYGKASLATLRAWHQKGRIVTPFPLFNFPPRQANAPAR